MRIIFLGILSILFCVACSEQYDHKGKTPLVELDGNFLYREDLQAALPERVSTDDNLQSIISVTGWRIYCSMRKHKVIFPIMGK